MSSEISLTNSVYSDRHAHLTYGINPESDKGVEFGALDWPVFKKEDANIKFVDFTSTQELKRISYASNVDNIVEVDFVWTGSGSLAKVIGASECFDFAIASHVVEHIPNVLGWFRGIYDVLRPGGRLNLAVPDKRFTFDVDRKVTTIAEMVEADLLDLQVPNLRQVFDHVSLVRQIGPGAIWEDERSISSFPRMSGENALETALKMANNVLREGTYHDTHCSVFTPASFLSVIEDATRLRIFPFYIDKFIATGPGGHSPSGFEFFVSFLKPAIDKGSHHRLIERVSQLREDLRQVNRAFSLLA